MDRRSLAMGQIDLSISCGSSQALTVVSPESRELLLLALAVIDVESDSAADKLACVGAGEAASAAASVNTSSSSSSLSGGTSRSHNSLHSSFVVVVLRLAMCLP